MTLKIYHHPNCTSCKKALKHLQQREVNFTAHNIIDLPPGQKELTAMLRNYQGNIRRLFNTSGQAYRQADLKTKLGQLSDEQALALLASDGMLVKRPFIIDDDGNGLVGYNEAALTELLA